VCGGKRGYHTSLEVHHIIPLNGAYRAWSKLNHPDNLIALCHDCHQTRHDELREIELTEKKKEKLRQASDVSLVENGQLRLL
jgi:5-methylcytosine-specific restriction endonuclease McrA